MSPSPTGPRQPTLQWSRSLSFASNNSVRVTYPVLFMKKTAAQQVELQVTQLPGRVRTQTRVPGLCHRISHSFPIPRVPPDVSNRQRSRACRPTGTRRAHLAARLQNGQQGAGSQSANLSAPLPRRSGGHVPRPQPGGRQPGLQGCHVKERKRLGGRPGAAPSPPPAAAAPFLSPSPLAAPALPPRLPATGPGCFPHFPRPLRTRLSQGRVSITEATRLGRRLENNLSLWFQRLNS